MLRHISQTPTSPARADVGFGSKTFLIRPTSYLSTRRQSPLTCCGSTVGTHAARGAVCLSSCVLILAGGSFRSFEGKVGIHRPYPDKSGTSIDVPTPQRTVAAANAVQKPRTFQAIADKFYPRHLFGRSCVSSATRSYSFATHRRSCFDCSSCIDSATTRASSARFRQSFGLRPTTLAALIMVSSHTFIRPEPERRMGRSKGSRSTEISMKPNALLWHFDWPSLHLR